ncbi:MAG: hypothetical protein R3D89_11385 [Sphingomonadaceae bacterium]
MNKRADRVIGETVVVTQAIEGGRQVKLGDSNASRACAPCAAPLRVSADGVVLLVEAAGSRLVGTFFLAESKIHFNGNPYVEKHGAFVMR